MTSVFATPTYTAAAYPHRYEGALHTVTLAGGIPSDPKVAEGWIKTKLADADDLLREAVAETMAERGITAEEAARLVGETKHLNGFKRDAERAGELYIEGRQLKAALKEAACIRWPDRRWGPTRKGTRSFFAEHFFVVDDRLHLGVTSPTDIAQHFPKSRFGSSIQLTEYVEDAKVEFALITDHALADEEWAMVWLTAEQQGLGAMRSQGYGRFEVVRWEQVR